MTVGDGVLALARGPEDVEEFAREGADLAVTIVAQIVAVERELAAFLEADEVLESCRIGIAAACGERHDGALLERGKPEVVGDEAVKHAERVEKGSAPAAVEPVAAADIGAGGRNVAEAVHDQHRRLLERRGKEDRGMRVVMADLDDRRQPGEAEPPAQLVLEPGREEHDAAVLRRVRARVQQAEAGWQVPQDRLGERPAQLPRVPGRRHDIDIADVELQLREGGLEREQRELERMLLPAEPLLLQHKRRHAVLQEGQTAVVGVADNAENPQGKSPCPGTAMVWWRCSSSLGGMGPVSVAQAISGGRT